MKIYYTKVRSLSSKDNQGNFDRFKLEYETLNDQINSRSSAVWMIASIFIPVTWIIFAQAMISGNTIGLGGIMILGSVSVFSNLIVCIFFKYVNHLNGKTYAGLRVLEKQLEICVHGYQYNFSGIWFRRIGRKMIYILNLISIAAWLYLGLLFGYFTYYSYQAASFLLLLRQFTPVMDTTPLFFWYLFNWSIIDDPLWGYIVGMLIIGEFGFYLLVSEEEEEKESWCIDCKERDKKNDQCGKYGVPIEMKHMQKRKQKGATSKTLIIIGFLISSISAVFLVNYLYSSVWVPPNPLALCILIIIMALGLLIAAHFLRK